MNLKKNVALISGGEGYEHEISEISAMNLFSLIDKTRYNIFIIHITERGSWYISRCECEKYIKYSFEESKFSEAFPMMLGETSGIFTNGRIIPIDCAIPCLHGNMGEDGNVQGALRVAHISYIGQDVYASALTSDKIYTKLAATYLNIPTAKWILFDGKNPRRSKEEAEAKLGYPLFIKPARLGSSYGAHPVYSESEFDSALEDACRYDERILIEELVRFDYELECAFFDDGTRVIVPGGKVLSSGIFYDFDSKYNESLSPRTESKTDSFSEIEKKISEYTESLASLIGIRHLSRFDFFVSKDGKIFFNEINAFPGMTETSLYPRLVQNVGRNKGDFINLLIDRVCSDDRRI